MPPSGPVEDAQDGDWPGGPGFTAVLASLSTESEARAGQLRATARGLDAGVLFSTDFRSLRPGYWVVFSGDFASAGEAAERAERAHGLGYSDAYPRFVAP
ncbi:MAG: SPOR domain-containing protein [Solirubrobacterales bacterium]